MRVLLVSTYELGHQPLHVASPAAALRRAGHEVACLDLAVEMWDPERVEDRVEARVPGDVHPLGVHLLDRGRGR